VGLAEGRVVVPVPPNSSVTDLSLSDGTVTLEGSILESGEAERIYEEIVRRLIDPALLQSLGDDLYEVRAFPVPPGETRQVRFTVTTPLVAEGDQAVVSIPWSRMSPRPASAVVTGDVDVSWEVRAAVAPTYALDVERLGEGRLSLSWESPSEWRAASDFTLYLSGGEGLLSTQLLPYRPSSEDGYFALLFAPVVEVESAVARDVIIVLDSSGSMEGEKLTQAQAAARFILERLGEDDRFGMVQFARSVQTFGGELQPSSRSAAGIEFVDGIRAGGGTNIAGALSEAFALAEGDRPATIVFLTDGLPTVGVENPGSILDVAKAGDPGRTQLFSFGVGYDVDTILLDSLAREFVGTSHYVTPEERIDTEVSRLFERISTPVLTDVTVTIDGGDVSALAPEAITGIFAGTQTLLTGRYGESGPVTVTVDGNTSAGAESFVYEVTLPSRSSGDPTVAQLWAQQRVADLLTELRIEGSRDALIEEIVAIATQFGIVTPFTSYLAEEPQLAFAADEAAESVADAALAAPSSGAQAVEAADDEDLRAGGVALGTEMVRVLGANSYVLRDGVWTQSSYELGSAAPEVLVGSAAFAALIEAQPELATAAQLGVRVIAAGPDGFVTLVWPDAGSSEAVHLPESNGATGAAEDISAVQSDASPGGGSPSSGVAGGTDEAPGTTTSESAASETTEVGRDGSSAAELAGDDDGGSAGLWIGLGLGLAALLIVGGGAIVRRLGR
jgi:Ca-activated chloride channel family protein